MSCVVLGDSYSLVPLGNIRAFQCFKDQASYSTLVVYSVISKPTLTVVRYSLVPLDESNQGGSPLSPCCMHCGLALLRPASSLSAKRGPAVPGLRKSQNIPYILPILRDPDQSPIYIPILRELGANPQGAGRQWAVGRRKYSMARQTDFQAPF